MRKLSVFALTAATALSLSTFAPMLSHAAVGTYRLPGGNGAMIVIGGNGADCNIGIPNFPNINIPGINTPGSNIPDNSLPTPEFPVPDGNVPDTNPPADDTPSYDGQDAYAAQVLNLVNEERAKAGLSPLTLNQNAAAAAQLRAQEIEKSFSHTRPDGSSFTTALTAYGVNYRGAGENIAYGQKTPEKVMEGWMNSAGHRANILNKNFTSIGVGHYRSASGVDYWTQLFIN